MTVETYRDGALVRRADDATRTVTDYTADPPTVRPYTAEDYRCIQSHTTQAGWTPPVVPALWTPQG